jgi:hypothetical protein
VSAYDSRADRLARIARPLKPARAPFYVQHPTRELVLVGWWWQPADADSPEPLGHNYEAALMVLTLRIDRSAAA